MYGFVRGKMTVETCENDVGICKKCNRLVTDCMTMKVVNEGIIQNIVCLNCDIEKFETIYIKKTLKSSILYMPDTQYWSPYKFQGKIVNNKP